MYIVYRSKNHEGEQYYNVNSVIGIFDNYIDAKTQLIKQVDKLKYKYDLDENDDLEYLLLTCFTKNNKDIKCSGLLCFEIIKKTIVKNVIKFK